MELDEIVTILNEQSTQATLLEGWDNSMASLPSSDLPFLKAKAVQSNIEQCGLDTHLTSSLVATAKAIEESPSLRPLAWHLYQRLFHTNDGDLQGDSWPELTHALAEQSGHFYLLVSITLAPLLKQRHTKKGIPFEITRNTCRAVQGFCLNYMKGHDGYAGICKSQIAWLQNHARGKIFRLGRLEYYITHFDKEYSGGCNIYRHKQSQRVLALAHDGARFDKNGRAWSYNDIDEQAWTAKLSITESKIIASPLSPEGIAQRRPITLSATEWTNEVSPQSWVLSMHIPNGGSLTPELFKDSMQRAFDFFDKHYPEQPVRAIACKSWLYGEMLEKILPINSNIVTNIQEVYRWATHSESTSDSLWFIFCQKGEKSNLDGIQANSSLEHAVLNYVQAGKIWREASIFFLRKDLPHFGTLFYRTPPS